MKHLFSMALLALAASGSFNVNAQGPNYIPGDVLVMVRPDADPTALVRDLAVVEGAVTGIRVEREVSAPMRTWLLQYDDRALPQWKMLRAVQNHDAVQMAQNNHLVKDRIVPNDPQYAQQWHHLNINSAAAWDISTGGLTATGDSIVVCIIESADVTHPDLIANAWFNRAEIASNGIDDDGNGYTDDYRGWNTPNGNDAVYSGSHGTQVAGMIGATGDNSLGVVGANWAVKMMVVNYGGTQEAQVIAAYTYPLVMRRRYNASNGAEGAFVVATNASWGIDNGQPSSSPLWCAMYDTLGTAGILNCGATANNNVNVDAVGDLPTACPSDFMISVTATNTTDQRTFSGYGLTTIDVGAPGENVRTTSIGGGYGSTSGTSFASPLTAGVIGLLYSAPCATMMSVVHASPSEGALYVRQKLFEGVDQVGNLPGQTVTGGRINSGTSMELIMAGCGSCPAPFGATVSASNGNATYGWNATNSGPFNVRYRMVGSADWTDLFSVEENNVMVTGLDPCVAYEFQVEMECGGETSGYSQSTLLQPPVEIAPTIVTNGYPVICSGQSIALTSSVASNIEWSNGSTNQTVSIDQSGTYTVTFNGQCGTYTSAPLVVEVLVTPPAPTANGVQLPAPGTATLNATGTNILWYGQAAGGPLVGSGSPWTTPFLNTTTDFWAASSVSNNVPISYGGRQSNTTSGQYHNNGTNYQLFTANQPFAIRSVKVYANGAGNRAIAVVNQASGATIATGNFSIPDGESRVQLNFQVPGPGQYGLRIVSGDPQLWRDGIGSNPSYPYALSTLGSMTSSSVTGANATAYYYFFYDWEVSPFEVVCASERVPVTVEMPTGIEDAAGNGMQVNVFPVPADGEVYFDIAGASAGRVLQIAVLDNTGRVVTVKTSSNGRAVLGTTMLAEGLYVYRITDRGTEVATGKFSVAH